MAAGTLSVLESVITVVWQIVEMWVGTCSWSHIWMVLLSVSASDNNAMGVTGGAGTDEGGISIGMGMGGSLPNGKVWQ
jgi:hypothetical protein